MPKIQVEFDVPAGVLPDGRERRLFVEAVKRQAVLELLREGTISQGCAAELLGVCRAELIELMGRLGLDHVDHPAAELEADSRAAEQVLRRGGA